MKMKNAFLILVVFTVAMMGLPNSVFALTYQLNSTAAFDGSVSSSGTIVQDTFTANTGEYTLGNIPYRAILVFNMSQAPIATKHIKNATLVFSASQSGDVNPLGNLTMYPIDANAGTFEAGDYNSAPLYSDPGELAWQQGDPVSVMRANATYGLYYFINDGYDAGCFRFQFKNETIAAAAPNGMSIDTAKSGTVADRPRIYVEIEDPDPTSITPSSGAPDTTVSITNLAGQYFNTNGGTGARLKKSGESDIEATSVTVVSAGKITCSFDLTGAAEGTWDVEVYNTDTTTGTLVGAFTVATEPVPPAVVPTLQEWGMILMALLLVGSMVIYGRKNRTA